MKAAAPRRIDSCEPPCGEARLLSVQAIFNRP
jgi:hypothetical protein